jgi:hypothetical protein
MKSQSGKKRTAKNAKALLEQLVRSAPKTAPRHQWHDLAELIFDSGALLSATASTFTVATADGTLMKDIEDGWTEKHYQYLAPYLSATSEPELNKAMIAKAVLLNMLRQLRCEEPQTAWWLLEKRFGIDEEQWLPRYVKTNGFLEVAEEMTQALDEYRKTTPRPVVSKKERPRWDEMLRRLYVGDLVIKEFRQAAKNQSLVLASFQELEFRHRIDDPLSGRSGEPYHKRHQRLRDTIVSLNEDHKTPGIIHFKGDGTGKRIIWEWCE